MSDDSKMAAALVQMSLWYRGLLAVRSWVGVPGPLGGMLGPLRVFSVEENPYYGKYREKIQELRRSDPAKFEARMAQKKKVKTPPLGSSSSSKQAEFVSQVEERVGCGFTKNKTLDSILNLEMVSDKSADEIKQIWSEFFSTKDTVYAIIPTEAFQLMWKRTKSCPAFLYAVPRDEGYEFFVGQWSGLELHFTSLINIQSVGDSAPSQLILYHFGELQDSKGVVLMTSEMDSKFLSLQEAQCLANQVQYFYAGDAFHLVETFNHNPSTFKYMSVITLLQQSGLWKSKAAH